MSFKSTYLFFVALIILSSSASILINENTNEIKLITTQKVFQVGNTINIKFSTSKVVKPHLYLSSSYGTTLISPTYNSNTLNYKIPKNITDKSGLLNWQLLTENSSLKGILTLNPKSTVAKLETYLGPPSIVAGGKDYAMIVVIPTDDLDNPVKDSTLVNLKHQFFTTTINKKLLTRNLFAYYNIFSENEKGRLLISSECLNTNSKEYSVDILPSIPTNFSIYANRAHNYADGNQLTTFSTSIISDAFGNIISDGTFVEFFIKNKNNNILKASGATINGIATAKILHPDHDELWQIKAYIRGIAESNLISLNYKSAVNDYNVTFSENNRSILVGPIKSFMNQLIPDGLQVSLSIYKDNELVKVLTETTRRGNAKFRLNNDIFKNDNYIIKIKAAGINKTYENKKLL